VVKHDSIALGVTDLVRSKYRFVFELGRPYRDLLPTPIHSRGMLKKCWFDGASKMKQCIQN
jgi:hypothetical protein